MKFPYGICDFKKIISSGFFYCDRTSHISFLEQGENQLFIRPRRFGKSLLLSTLFYYYDLASSADFEKLFGNLAIGKNPTPLRNRYFVLRWDFSCVDPSGTVEQIKKALHDHINGRIDSFLKYYSDYGLEGVVIHPDNALHSLESLLGATRSAGHPVYLLIDEYDNFANEVLTGVRRNEERRYDALVFEEGPLRTLFKAVKSLGGSDQFDRVFITGVSPVVMSDITSGYNVAENIYLNGELNALCGFTRREVSEALACLQEECGFGAGWQAETEALMQTWYNGYIFASDAGEKVYNPTLVLYFLKTVQRTCKPPYEMLDTNLATDQAKLEYIAKIPGGSGLLMDLFHEDMEVAISGLASRFGMRAMLKDQTKDNSFMVSLLYYFGVLTLDGRNHLGKLRLRVPNLVIRKLYVEQMGEMLLPDPSERDAGKWAAEKVYQEGKMAELCAFVEERYFRVFRNPDYRWANELTIKTAFLTLLYNDALYIMDSEPETGRRRADLTMIIRPEMRKYEIFDVLLEFKYVGLKEAGLTGEGAARLTEDELKALPAMKKAMEEGTAQVLAYGAHLKQRHPELRLKSFVVTALGFERLCWEGLA